MVRNLIAQASAETGLTGPFVANSGTLVPAREWLCDATAPMTQRGWSSLKIVARSRPEFFHACKSPRDAGLASALTEAIVERRVRFSGHTNVSRTTSEIFRAGLLHRHPQRFRVDRQNRQTQHHALYGLNPKAHRGP